MKRLYGLNDRWLAEELLRLVRRVRQEHPDKLGTRGFDPFDKWLVWDVAPEVARRLGARNLLAAESLDWRVRAADGPKLRGIVGCCFALCSMRVLVDVSPHPTAAYLLSCDVADGNPVSMAWDRLCPAPPVGEDSGDIVARRLRAVSRERGLDETAEWSPRLQHWKPEHDAMDVASRAS